MTRLDVILVEPQEGGNLGSICRALKTLGFRPPMLLDAPVDIEAAPEARRLAHGAREYLDEIERVVNFEEFEERYDFLVGTTARRRRAVSEYIDARQLPALLEAKGGTVSKVALLFGSEASGLSSGILRRCDLVSTVPLATSYPSLNLAQAVLLYAYELSPLHSRARGEASSRAEGTEYRALRRRVEAILQEGRGNPALSGRVLERLALLEAQDVDLLHSVLNLLRR